MPRNDGDEEEDKEEWTPEIPTVVPPRPSVQKYQAMWDYYHSIKHLFELEGMTNEIISQNM